MSGRRAHEVMSVSENPRRPSSACCPRLLDVEERIEVAGVICSGAQRGARLWTDARTANARGDSRGACPSAIPLAFRREDRPRGGVAVVGPTRIAISREASAPERSFPRRASRGSARGPARALPRSRARVVPPRASVVVRVSTEHAAGLRRVVSFATTYASAAVFLSSRVFDKSKSNCERVTSFPSVAMSSSTRLSSSLASTRVVAPSSARLARRASASARCVAEAGGTIRREVLDRS